MPTHISDTTVFWTQVFLIDGFRRCNPLQNIHYESVTPKILFIKGLTAKKEKPAGLAGASLTLV
jgi:hypothetical protein